MPITGPQMCSSRVQQQCQGPTLKGHQNERKLRPRFHAQRPFRSDFASRGSGFEPPSAPPICISNADADEAAVLSVHWVNPGEAAAFLLYPRNAVAIPSLSDRTPPFRSTGPGVGLRRNRLWEKHLRQGDR